MRRTIILFALMISLLPVSGCGDAAGCREDFLGFRDTLSQAEAVQFTADLTADFGGEAAEYELGCRRSGDETVVDVLSPEILSGVRARVENGSLDLEYDGAILDAGTLTDGGVTPVSALPCLLDTLASGYLKLCWREKDGDTDYLVAQLSVSDTAYAVVWLRAGDLVPAAAEIYEGENLAVRCDITNWTIG